MMITTITMASASRKDHGLLKKMRNLFSTFTNMVMEVGELSLN